MLREGGVADGYDELDELRGIHNNCGDFLLQLDAHEHARTGIEKLKVNTTACTAPETPEPGEHPLMLMMRNVQPDDLSPKAALEKLYSLKKLLYSLFH